MNAAQTIAKLHDDRDQEIFDHITEEVGKYLQDTKWLLSQSSHTRGDDNKIRYKFNVIGFLREFVEEDERQWPSYQLKDKLTKYYFDQGFEVHFDVSDEMILKINGWDIGLEASDDSETA